MVSSFALSPDGGETYVSRSLSLVVASSILMTAATARLAARVIAAPGQRWQAAR